MKRCLILPILAVAAFVSQGWSAQMCLYSSGDCWPDDGGCLTAGWLFDGGTEGVGTMCSGGTWTGQGKGGNPPTSAGTSLGCCKWDNAATNPQGKCWDVFVAGEAADCATGTNQFWSGACPDKTGTCPTGTPTTSSGSTGGATSSASTGGGNGTRGDCKNSSGQVLFCGYPTGCYKQQNEYSNAGNLCTDNSTAGCEPCSEKIAHCENTGGLFIGVNPSAINESNKYGDNVDCKANGGVQVGGKEDCAGATCMWEGKCEVLSPDPGGDYGPATANCAEAKAHCQNTSGTLYTTEAACKTASIKKLPFSATENIVKAMQNGVNVQLMSSAKVQIYDLKGNLVRSINLAQGSYNVGMSDLARGTYIVRVTGASWNQNITVPVK